MLLHDFHFIRPFWLLALLVFPWLLRRAGRPQAAAWTGVCDPHLLPYLLTQPLQRPQRWARWLFALGWLLAVLALAGPTWSKLPRPLLQHDQAQVIVLDLSRSMDAADLKPSRLAQARFKVLDLLKRSTEGQTALLAFAGDVHVVSPLTTDAATIAALVPALNSELVPRQGSDVAAALTRAVSLLQQGGASQGQVLLFTDGMQNVDAALAAARQLQQQGYRLSVLGLGTPQGAPVSLKEGSFLKDSQGNVVMPRLDSAALSQLAQAGGGFYTPLTTDDQDLQTLLYTSASVADFNPLTKAAQGQLDEAWEEQGPWLLLLLLPVAALGFRRGWLAVLLLCVLLPQPESAWAFNWDDLWQRPDQQGAATLAAGQAGEAAQQFESPDWRATAHYQAGDYAQAAQAFAQLDTAAGHYNRGNALAKLGKLAEAASAYREALKRRPDDADAQANLQLVETLLKQQQAQDQPDKNQQDQNKPDQKQQDQSEADKQKQDKSGEQQDQQQQDKSGQDQQAQDKSGQDQQAQDKPGQDQQQPDKPGQAQQAQDKPGQEPQPDKTAQTTPAGTEEQAPPASDQAVREALQQQAAQPKLESETPANTTATQAAAVDPEVRREHEQAMALEQWLNRVPDDPGGLLRRKFYLESQRHQQSGPAPATQESNPSW